LAQQLQQMQHIIFQINRIYFLEQFFATFCNKKFVCHFLGAFDNKVAVL